jgi:hypothetical protein
MDRRTRLSLVWGLAGGLTFLVLVQTTRLFGDLSLGVPRVAPIAVAVFAVTGGLGWIVEGRLGENRQV